MKISIIDNKISFIFNDYKENTDSPKVFYATNGNRIFKVIPITAKPEEPLSLVDSYLFAFNKTNGIFDIPTHFFKEENFEKWDDVSQIDKETFYKEVFNIIKHRFVLGYMIKHYNKTATDTKYKFNDYYIGDDIHKGVLADLISDKENKFTQSDVATVIEEVCKISRIPESFTNDLKLALKKTFYDSEISEEEKNTIINNILENESISGKSATLSPRVWDMVFEQITQNRLMAKMFYSNFSKGKIK